MTTRIVKQYPIFWHHEDDTDAKDQSSSSLNIDDATARRSLPRMSSFSSLPCMSMNDLTTTPFVSYHGVDECYGIDEDIVTQYRLGLRTNGGNEIGIVAAKEAKQSSTEQEGRRKSSRRRSSKKKRKQKKKSKPKQPSLKERRRTSNAAVRELRSRNWFHYFNYLHQDEQPQLHQTTRQQVTEEDEELVSKGILQEDDLMESSTSSSYQEEEDCLKLLMYSQPLSAIGQNVGRTSLAEILDDSIDLLVRKEDLVEGDKAVTSQEDVQGKTSPSATTDSRGENQGALIPYESRRYQKRQGIAVGGRRWTQSTTREQFPLQADMEEDEGRKDILPKPVGNHRLECTDEQLHDSVSSSYSFHEFTPLDDDDVPPSPAEDIMQSLSPSSPDQENRRKVAMAFTRSPSISCQAFIPFNETDDDVDTALDETDVATTLQPVTATTQPSSNPNKTKKKVQFPSTPKKSASTPVDSPQKATSTSNKSPMKRTSTLDDSPKKRTSTSKSPTKKSPTQSNHKKRTSTSKSPTKSLSTPSSPKKRSSTLKSLIKRSSSLSSPKSKKRGSTSKSPKKGSSTSKSPKKSSPRPSQQQSLEVLNEDSTSSLMAPPFCDDDVDVVVPSTPTNRPKKKSKKRRNSSHGSTKGAETSPNTGSSEAIVVPSLDDNDDVVVPSSPSNSDKRKSPKRKKKKLSSSSNKKHVSLSPKLSSKPSLKKQSSIPEELSDTVPPSTSSFSPTSPGSKKKLDTKHPPQDDERSTTTATTAATTIANSSSHSSSSSCDDDDKPNDEEDVVVQDERDKSIEALREKIKAMERKIDQVEDDTLEQLSSLAEDQDIRLAHMEWKHKKDLKEIEWEAHMNNKSLINEWNDDLDTLSEEEKQALIENLRRENESLREDAKFQRELHTMRFDQFQRIELSGDQVEQDCDYLKEWVERKEQQRDRLKSIEQSLVTDCIPFQREQIRECNRHCVSEHHIKNFFQHKIDQMVHAILFESHCTDSELYNDIDFIVKMGETRVNNIPTVPVPEELMPYLI